MRSRRVAHRPDAQRRERHPRAPRAGGIRQAGRLPRQPAAVALGHDRVGQHRPHGEARFRQCQPGSDAPRWLGADERMKKPWPLLALGIGAFLIPALLTLPASVVLSFVHPADLTLSGISGTIWKGRAQAVRSGTVHLGSVDWGINLLALFTGRLGADVKVARSDGFAQGAIAASASGITLRRFNASLPVSALPPSVVRGGWTGTL